MPSNFKALAAASGGEPTDANFKNVTLLLHGDGSNGAQNNTFIDSSTNNFTITRNGNTTQGSFSPYGSNWSNYFDGSGDYLTVPDNAGFSYGTGDFTIECFVFASGLGATRRLYYHITTSSTQVTIYQLNTNYIGFYAANGGSVIVDMLSNTLLPANTWTHIAIVRSGNSFTLYQNGVSVATATSSASMPDPSGSVNIGALDTGNESWLGYISNFRVVKGTAVYTSAFTPSTTPLTAITNTSLLTCAYNRFRDGSTNNFTITRNGDVKVTNFAPFAPSSAYSTTTNGGSAYFDGSGDYLSYSQSAGNLGTGDWTIECWVYAPSTPVNYSSLMNKNWIFGMNDGDFNWALKHDNGYMSFAYVSGGISNITTTIAPAVGAWKHYAVTRSGTTVRIYADGVLDTTATIPSGLSFGTATTTSVFTGYNSRDNCYTTGWISGFRVIVGTALYTGSTYTIPTSPPTAVTNTRFLLNATNAAIFDNSMKNDLETVGNAQISTSVKKFGTGSMYFDGSGDYIYPVASPNLAMGTGDFTVEGWIYATGTPSDSPIFECRSTGSATDGFTLTAFSSSVIRVFCGSALISSSGTTYVNQWVHLAVVRSSGTTTFYINGTSVGSTTSTINWTNQDVIVGGGRYSSGSSINVSFTGYIDDFRITKGVARYTSNFTAPTAPFPNK